MQALPLIKQEYVHTFENHLFLIRFIYGASVFSTRIFSRSRYTQKFFIPMVFAARGFICSTPDLQLLVGHFGDRLALFFASYSLMKCVSENFAYENCFFFVFVFFLEIRSS